MSLRSQIVFGFFTATLVLPAVSTFAQTPAPAQKAPPVRIRGIVDVSDAKTLSITTRDGRTQTVILNDATRYSAVKALSMSAIKPGSFIGSAGRPGANGAIEALEVVVFPEEARGTGEGHYDWDLLPGSSMTNATVSAMVSGNAGRNLELTYQGKKIKINVPKNVPVVTFVPALAQDLTAGKTVFVVASEADGGQLNAERIVLEKDGVKPPM